MALMRMETEGLNPPNPSGYASASMCKISLQSDNRVLSYGQKTTFTARRICIARTVPWQDFFSVRLSVRLSVCLSVRPSHAGILSKRFSISSNFFSPSGFPYTSFSTPNGMAIIRRGPPNGGAKCKGV